MLSPDLRPPNESWGVGDIRELVNVNPVLSQWLSGPADPIHYHTDPPVVFKGASEHLDLAVRSTPMPLVGPARTRFRSRLAESQAASRENPAGSAHGEVPRSPPLAVRRSIGYGQSQGLPGPAGDGIATVEDRQRRRGSEQQSPPVPYFACPLAPDTPAPSSRRTSSAPWASASSFIFAISRGRGFIPQSVVK